MVRGKSPMAALKDVLGFFVKVESDDRDGPSLSERELKDILDEKPSAVAPGAAKPRASAPSPQGPAPAPRPRATMPMTGTPRAPMPSPRVSEVAGPLVMQMQSPVGAVPSAGAASGDVPDFATVYKAAKIPPPEHGYDTDKLATMLDNPRLQGMSDPVKANSVLMALEVAGVPIQEVIADAVARDRALDDFEAWWAAKVGQVEADKRAENAALEDEMNRAMEAMREKIRANHAAVQQAVETFSRWKEMKRAEEQRLHRVVSPFVSENPITLNTGMIAPTGGDPGAGPAR